MLIAALEDWAFRGRATVVNSYPSVLETLQKHVDKAMKSSLGFFGESKPAMGKWLWVKNMYPKWLALGKWKHGLKPAVQSLVV